MKGPDRNNSSQQSSQQIEEYLYEEEADDLPRHGLISALIIGCIGGIIALAVPIAIVLFNASLFNTAAHLGDNISYEMASSINMWNCSGAFVDLLMAFAIGMIVGKIAVKRRLGFLAGAIAGGIVYLGKFLTQYIPDYPGVIKTGTGGPWLPGVLIALGLLLLWSVVGGLMSLWGARIATRNHPYYYPQPKE